MTRHDASGGRGIVLTGATGFIGSHLRAALVADAQVFAVTRRDPPAPSAGIRWIAADLARNSAFTWPAAADTLIYAAQSRAYRDVPGGCGDMLDVNAHGLIRLLAAGVPGGLRRVIYLSTANVYDRSGGAIAETAPPRPESFYAHSKRVGEAVVEAYSTALDCTILRLFTPYGPGQQDMLIPRLFERLERGAAIQTGPDGGLLLSPLYIDDLVAAMARLVAAPLAVGCRVFNLGGEQPVTIRDLATIMAAIIGRVPAFDIVASERRSGWAADIDKAGRELGWAPVVSLRDGLARTSASMATPAAGAARPV